VLASAATTRPGVVLRRRRAGDFDFAKPFLPAGIAGVSAIGCLNDAEKRNAEPNPQHGYCHIFAFVEEYIVPMVVDHARRDVYGDETRLRTLLRFAEELKRW
jgi:hypothetical protein